MLYLLFYEGFIFSINFQFYNLKNIPITFEDAQNLNSLILEINDKAYKLQLQNNTLNLTNLKYNICSYSAKLFNEHSYGIFDICNLKGKIFTKNKLIEIDKEIKVTMQKNMLEEGEKTKYSGNNKYMKIFIINDSERVRHYGTDINNYTMDIYKQAKKIIEAEDWGKYKMKLVLNGILNIMDENFEDIRVEDDRIEKIESDEEESSDYKYMMNKQTEVGDQFELEKILDAKRDVKKQNRIKRKKASNYSKPKKFYENKKTRKNTEQIISQKSKKSPKSDKLYENGSNKDLNGNSEFKNTKDISNTVSNADPNKGDSKAYNSALNHLNFIENIKRPCIKLIYKDKSVFDQKAINILDAETESRLRELSDKNIYKYKLSRHTDFDFDKVQDYSQETNETQYSDELKKFADIFEKIKTDQRDTNSLLVASNLVIMFTTKKDNANVEGMTFIGGACSTNDSYSIIRLKSSDSNFYHGKVLAHEILHSLDARHDTDCGDGFLMEQQGCTTCMEDERKISKCTIRQVVRFIDKQESKCFALNELCGNGVLDDGEECDSGLPFGSDCCTSTCKLREGCECDDRNGDCCINCKLLKKHTININSKKSNSCIRRSFCNGISSECTNEFKDDGEECPNGFCKNGVCQSRELFCERNERKFDSTCSLANECKLICADENLRCSLMGTVKDGIKSPLFLPDGMPCVFENMEGKCLKGECQIKYQPTKYLLPIIFLGIIILIVVIMLVFLI